MSEHPQPAVPDMRSVFPEAASLFSSVPFSLPELLKTCDVVLDTNVLLLPYKTGRDSLDAIDGVYKQLAKDNRLSVPGHVAREFATHRPGFLGSMIQGLADLKSRLPPARTPEFPMLDGLPEWVALRKSDDALQTAIKRYSADVDAVIACASRWGPTDPVLQRYSSVFLPNVIVDPQIDMPAAKADFEFRCTHLIPPGYKDAKKTANAIGDYLIWLTILSIGKTNGRDLVFVTGEEKADWQHRSNNTSLIPRVELIDEFRRASGGKQFYIVNASSLLQHLSKDVSKNTLDSVKAVEEEPRNVEEVISCPYCNEPVRWRIGLGAHASAKPKCERCGKRFHAHRVKGQLVVRRPFERKAMSETMRSWFFSHYEDPANGVPYDSAEGGYQFWNGGPYTVRDVLHDEFDGTYPDHAIDELSDSIAVEHGELWVRTGEY